MKKLAAALLTAMAMAGVPASLAPVAHADVCGDVGGRHVDVGGCTHVGADIAVGATVAGADEAAGQEVARLAVGVSAPRASRYPPPRGATVGRPCLRSGTQEVHT